MINQSGYNDTYRGKQNSIPRRKCINKRKRNHLEKNPEKWLKFFFKSVFKLPFADIHKEIIHKCQYSIESAGRLAVACPRGYGKSTVVNGMALWAVFSGKTTFPVVIPWGKKSVTQAWRFWITALTQNELLADYYPEFCDVYVKSRGISQKIKSITWQDNKKITGAEVNKGEGLIVLPDGLGLIASSSLKANPRGIQYTVTRDGQQFVYRPTLVLLDDPSDRTTARSKEGTDNNIAFINADVLGMGGEEKLACLMTCTIIEKGDTADRYLNNKSWSKVIGKAIVEWPDDFKNPESLTRMLWEEWNNIRIKGIENEDNGKTAIAFYKKNKKLLNKGFKVAWKHKFDKSIKEPDAYYSVMSKYYEDGHSAFFSEYQNDPIVEGNNTLYDLSEQVILSSLNNNQQYEIKPKHDTIVVSADINNYGIHWAAIAYRNDFTGHVVAYGNYTGGNSVIVEKNTNQTQTNKLIYQALVDFTNNLESLQLLRDGKRRPINGLLIDAGYCSDVVYRFVGNHQSSIPKLAARGLATSKYRITKSTLVGAPYEQCHTVDNGDNTWISFNADYWKEVAQRAWLSEVNAPGSLSIYGNTPDLHRDLARQICNEKLAIKAQDPNNGKWLYKWSTAPGWHDLGDCMYMSMVAASVLGLSTGQKKKVFRNATRKNSVRKLQI